MSVAPLNAETGKAMEMNIEKIPCKLPTVPLDISRSRARIGITMKVGMRNK